MGPNIAFSKIKVVHKAYLEQRIVMVVKEDFVVLNWPRNFMKPQTNRGRTLLLPV